MLTESLTDVPVDYQWIDWEHLYNYVGKAVLGDHSPLMTGQVAAYLERQARDMRQRADHLDNGAKLLRGTM